jgi:hypothetical protein
VVKPRFKAKKTIDNDPELFAMMQIAAEKNCWLSDLDDVPAGELELWLGYYEIKHREDEKARKKAEQKARATRRH